MSIDWNEVIKLADEKKLFVHPMEDKLLSFYRMGHHLRDTHYIMDSNGNIIAIGGRDYMATVIYRYPAHKVNEFVKEAEEKYKSYLGIKQGDERL